MSFQGKKNRYTCDTCCGQIITIDRDEGVTPFMLECRADRHCNGFMESSMYRHVTGEPTFEWRKATAEEYAAASDGMRHHFDQGGLDIHPVVPKSCE